MDDPRIRLPLDSLTLLSAAERLDRDAGDRACAAFLPAALECVEQSLHALSRGCHSAAHALIPPGDLHESISHRYARAAAAWPGAADGAGPSHERQAQLLASLDEAAAALRTAAACCARTSQLVAQTMDAPASIPARSLAGRGKARQPRVGRSMSHVQVAGGNGSLFHGSPSASSSPNK